MTIAQLIAELERYPKYLEVQVLLSEVTVTHEFGEYEIELSSTDALPLDRVTYQGYYVLLESK